MVSDERICGSCGRYVGAYEKCPYCGAEVYKRLSLKIFKYGSIIFSFVGLAILYFIAVKREIPAIKINQITPTMNFAYIRVQGNVVRYPIFDEKTEILTININDGTEDLIVKAYRVTALKMKELNKIPEIGDIIDLSGTIRMRGALKILTINIPEKVKIIKTSPVALELDEISDSYINKKISVSGIINDVRYYKNYISLFISDKSGKNKIKVPLNLNYLKGELPDFDIGQQLNVKGVLSYYSGNYSILPASLNDIEIVTKKVYIPELKIAQISDSYINRITKIRGRIIRLRRFSKGVALTISDGESDIDAVLWNNVYKKIPDKEKIKEGSEVSITGKIGVYKNKLQIVPALSKNFKIIKEAKEEFIAPVETEEKIVAIKDITSNDINKIVKIKGKIEKYFDFSKGRNLTINDGTGSISVILWNNVLNSLSEFEYITTGSIIAVKGRVEEYKNKLEIIPKYADDVEIIEINEYNEQTEENLKNYETNR